MTVDNMLQIACWIMDMKSSLKSSVGNGAWCGPKHWSVCMSTVRDCFAVATLVPKELTVSVRVDDDGTLGTWSIIVGGLGPMLRAK